MAGVSQESPSSYELIKKDGLSVHHRQFLNTTMRWSGAFMPLTHVDHYILKRDEIPKKNQKSDKEL